MKFLLGLDDEKRMEKYVRQQGCDRFPAKDQAPGIARLQEMISALQSGWREDLSGEVPVMQATGSEDEPICLWFPEAGVHPTHLATLLREIIPYDCVAGQVFIATFDHVMINLCGALVEQDRLSTGQPKIRVFEDGDEYERRFTDDGYLNEGPFGWFTSRDRDTHWVYGD